MEESPPWAWWQLELGHFESFLLRGDEQEEQWKRFREGYRSAALTWSLTLGLLGRSVPKPPSRTDD